MSEDRTPRVDRLTLTYTHHGDCEVCGRPCSRSRSFSGTELAPIRARADRWLESWGTRIWHRKCGGS